MWVSSVVIQMKIVCPAELSSVKGMLYIAASFETTDHYQNFCIIFFGLAVQTLVGAVSKRRNCLGWIKQRAIIRAEHFSLHNSSILCTFFHSSLHYCCFASRQRCITLQRMQKRGLGLTQRIFHQLLYALITRAGARVFCTLGKLKLFRPHCFNFILTTKFINFALSVIQITVHYIDVVG